MDNKRLIEAICVIALDIFPTAKWIAQDSDGRWYAYDVKPTNDGQEWFFKTNDPGEHSFITELAPPVNCAKEIYSIDEILNHVD